MRAICKDGETIPEDRWSPFVKNHLDWMQSSEGYTLIENYVQSADPEETEAESPAEPAQTVSESVSEKTYTIDGALYTESQIRELQDKLSSVLNS